MFINVDVRKLTDIGYNLTDHELQRNKSSKCLIIQTERTI